MYGSEVIVDWIKHAFIMKFNRHPASLFRKFAVILSDDVVLSMGRDDIGFSLQTPKVKVDTTTLFV